MKKNIYVSIFMLIFAFFLLYAIFRLPDWVSNTGVVLFVLTQTIIDLLDKKDGNEK
jgi:protein-S-isoprenylcysteine O-methyltransferase Ste14